MPILYDDPAVTYDSPYVTYDGVYQGPGVAQDIIECWVTTPSGAYIAHLDRSEASPFRRFSFSRELNTPGAGSLDYGLPNALLTANPTLFDPDNLVWMRYRGRTVTWVIEEDARKLDESEHASDWVTVAGRGVLQLLGDRLVWPPAFGETGNGLIPSTWSGVSSTLAVQALKNQKVLDIVGSTKGWNVGTRITVGNAHKSEQGLIASKTAGTITLKRKLAHTYAAGVPVFRRGNQWYEVDGQNAGAMLWELIDVANPRFATQIVQGTIETDAGDLWTQRFRFDNLLDVVDSVAASYGDVDMEGLTFHYYNQLGSVRSATVIFEEGADVKSVSRESSDRDRFSWVVGEGIGEGVFARFAIAKDVTVARRREAYLDAHDAANVALLQARTTSALGENVRRDSIGFDVSESRFAALTDYDLGDWVRVIAPSRGIDESLRIVAVYVAETDDETVRVSLDVNSPRTEYLLRLEQGQRSTAQSLGIHSRQPQGQLVPFAISGTGIFDTDEDMEVFFRLPDRMTLIVETVVNISFKKFWASARSAAAVAADVSTSGASSAASSASGGSSSPTSTSSDAAHYHNWANWAGASPGGYAATKYLTRGADGSAINIDVPNNASGTQNLTTQSGAAPHDHNVTVSAHTHGIAHSHNVDIPGHSHALTYGTFHEALPASWSVVPKVYFLDGTAWDLRWTGDPIDEDTAEIDISDIVDEPGSWKITLQSQASQPKNGRLGADVWGSVVGSIESE